MRIIYKSVLFALVTLTGCGSEEDGGAKGGSAGSGATGGSGASGATGGSGASGATGGSGASGATGGSGASGATGGSSASGGVGGGSGGVGGGECTEPDGGVGLPCDQAENDCPCDLMCSARRCRERNACGEVAISLEAPTTNEDGSCLTTLAGFKFRWGTTPGGPYEHELDVGLPCEEVGTAACGDGGTAPEQVCFYRLGGLENGDWYFVAYAYTTDGLESAASGEASITIDCH